MQFKDLRKQCHAMQFAIDEGIQAVIEDFAFIIGKPVPKLAIKLEEYMGRKYCAICGNFPVKPLGCYGDGETVFTYDEVDARLRSMRA